MLVVGSSPGKFFSCNIARGKHFFDLSNQLSLALLVEELRGTGLHLGVDQPDGPLPHHLLALVDLTEDPDDGPPRVPPDQGHDAVLDHRDLALVLGLQKLNKNIDNLGKVLDVLVFAQNR